jgi:hypothetical protein
MMSVKEAKTYIYDIYMDILSNEVDYKTNAIKQVE